MKASDIEALRGYARAILNLLDESGIEAELRLAHTAQRVEKVFENAPMYADRYPGFAHLIRCHVLTPTMVIRALGSKTKNVREAIEMLEKNRTIKRVALPLKTLGKKPETYVLTSKAHMLEQPTAPKPVDIHNDPFANEWVWSKHSSG